MTVTEDGKLKKDVFWNTAGSLIYALSIAVMTFLVMRIAGEEEGGIFGFGFSTFGQQMFTIAYFGMRSFQITDVRGEFGFSTYRRSRILTSLLAVTAALLYLSVMALAGTYTFRKAVIIFLLSLYKIADAYADVYECECQRAGFLWRGGRELCIRTMLAAVIFLLILSFAGNLAAAAAAAVAVQAAVIVIFRLRLYRDAGRVTGAAAGGRYGKGNVSAGEAAEETAKMVFIEKKNGSDDNASGGDPESGSEQGPGRISADKTGPAKKEDSRKNEVFLLLGSTVLLFLSVFLDFYVFSGAKYAVDRKLGDASSGIFNVLFMPTSVIYMTANFIIKPFLTRMAESLDAGDMERFAKIRRRIAWLILGLTAIALICALLLGRRALGICEWLLGDVYSGKLIGHVGDLFLIILGGGLYALANLYYYVLVIRRKQKMIFLVYLFGAMITVAGSGFIVGQMGLTGAALFYAAMMSMLAFGMKLCDLLSG